MINNLEYERAILTQLFLIVRREDLSYENPLLLQKDIWK